MLCPISKRLCMTLQDLSPSDFIYMKNYRCFLRPAFCRINFA